MSHCPNGSTAADLSIRGALSALEADDREDRLAEVVGRIKELTDDRMKTCGELADELDTLREHFMHNGGDFDDSAFKKCLLTEDVAFFIEDADAIVDALDLPQSERVKVLDEAILAALWCADPTA